jgi:hypothetical protein
MDVFVGANDNLGSKLSEMYLPPPVHAEPGRGGETGG